MLITRNINVTVQMAGLVSFGLYILISLLICNVINYCCSYEMNAVKTHRAVRVLASLVDHVFRHNW